MSPLRVNQRIKASEVRVVSEDGSDMGVLSIADALSLAASRKLDLVEIEPQTAPPVCQILDFGMYLYREAKKKRDSQG
jgi:translation initiation factor IF-3